MIHKKYRSNVKDITKSGTVVVAANAFNNVDSQGDVSLPGSFKKTIENIKSIYWYKNHNTDETLGIIKNLWEDDNYLNAEMNFNLEKEISRNMYSDYKFFAENERTVKHSVGVSTFKDKFEIKEDVRYVKEWKLWEISSLTKWAANDNTPTHLVKDFDINEYYTWMCKEGMHTDNFIKQIENLLKEIKEPVTPLEKQEDRAVSNTLVELINHIKI